MQLNPRGIMYWCACLLASPLAFVHAFDSVLNAYACTHSSCDS